MEKLKIALAYGADAVYGGVSHFSLRIRSGKEFTYESFGEGVKYAHALERKVYATVNGFPFNNQIKLLYTHLEKMADLNVDSFIISTPGVLKAALEVAPHIPVHLSTQANVLNYMDAAFYHDLGVQRIITAREMSLKDVVEIKERIPTLELEVFVHGSMCFAYSGRCLISTMQSGRVPNRGSCANDCRFDYTMYAENPDDGTLFKIEQDENGTHIMNAKDLNLSAHVEEILESGAIDSLKIEGRTKSPYYAAMTAKTYRSAIDDFYGDTFEAHKYVEALNSTASRGFTDAYLVSRPYEKSDTQNLSEAMVEGTHQVHAMVTEDGKWFVSKGQMFLETPCELVLPSENIQAVDNEVGKIYVENEQWYILFHRFVAENGKIWEEVHSGNVNKIELPVQLPSYTFIRREIASTRA